MFEINTFHGGERVHDESPTRHVISKGVSYELPSWISVNVTSVKRGDLIKTVFWTIRDLGKVEDLVIVIFVDLGGHFDPESIEYAASDSSGGREIETRDSEVFGPTKEEIRYDGYWRRRVRSNPRDKRRVEITKRVDH
jgi:hypothetical protein